MATASATASHSPTASATVTHTPVAYGDRQPDADPERGGIADHYAYPRQLCPTPSVTPVQGQLTWLFNGRKRLDQHWLAARRIHVRVSRQGKKPSLDLEDSASRFCTQPGLAPRVRLDLDPADCEERMHHRRLPTGFDIRHSHLPIFPALHRAAGTFDVPHRHGPRVRRGEPPTQLRMPAAITYVKCIGDCNGDDAVSIDELVLAVSIARSARTKPVIAWSLIATAAVPLRSTSSSRR